MTRKMRITAVAWALALAACAASSSDEGGRGSATGAAGSGSSSGSAGSSSSGAAGTSGGAAGTAPPLPPEKEVESSFEVPVATGRFVWVANPTSGRVAYVDASGLTVKTVEAGNGPTYLAAVPGAADAVIVLNTLSNDATFLRVTGTELETRTFAGLAAGSNSWAVSPDGRFAIAWTDARRLPAAPPTRGFHEVTILDLASQPGDPAAAAATIAVGYRPVSFAFAADGKRAFAVTEDGVSVIALPERTIAATVPLGAGGVTDASDTGDVSITADGRLAVVRREGSPEVAFVELATGTRTTIALASAVTDVDVLGAVAVAVARDAAEVAIVPLAAGAPAPAAVTHVKVPGETIGQVAITASGKTALLYSNAVAAERLTVLTLDGAAAPRAVKLHGSVLSALPTADGKFAVVLHPSEPPPTPVDTDGGVSGAAGAPATPAVTPLANAFSLVALDGTRPARIEMTDAPPRAGAPAPARDRVLLTVRDDARKIFGVYLGRLPALSVERYALASPPLATGVLAAANRGYVAQQHPEGRITFLTLDSGEARTLTGYELGARVVDWSSR
jgi:hypothetical protein